MRPLILMICILLGVCLYISFYNLFSAVFLRRVKWRISRGKRRSSSQTEPFPLRLWQVSPTIIEEWDQLLRGSGLSWQAEVYIKWRRLLVTICFFVLFGGFYLQQKSIIGSAMVESITGLLLLCILIATYLDKPILKQFGKYRSRYMVKEIYAICKQLLYYSSSKNNIHQKLRKCTPHAHRIRKEWLWLIHEWYENPEKALNTFAKRLGSDEAYRFSQTLNALRLYDHTSYYELLRERIMDYKEKLELYKEGRKETTSYLLFVLAGIPILNTFRLFIHPWVMEGQRLFDLLQ